MIFTIQVLSQKVNKIPLTSKELCYIVTKKEHIASKKNPQTQLNKILFNTHNTFQDFNNL